MLRRPPSPALIGVAAFWLVGCEPTLPPNPKSNGTAKVEPARMTATEIGAPLFPPKPVPDRPANADTGGLRYDEIIVRNCQVTVPFTQNVPSKNDGKLFDYCTEFDPAKENLPESEIVVHPRTQVKYRRLKVGEHVKPGQLIAVMDDSVPFANLSIAEAKLRANIAKAEADQEILKAAEAEYDMVRDLVLKNAAPLSELRRNQAQRDRAKADLAEAKGLIGQSTEEKNKAEITLREHEIKSDIAGEFRRLYRRAGESIKAYDPVAEIQNMEKLRVEGMVSLERVNLGQKLQLGQNPPKVVIERAEQIAQERSLEGHMGAVRAVSVSKDPRKPLIVSASDDKTVRVWDRLTRREVGHWPHNVAVQAVACTPKEADADLCLTGADDGVARLWDMTNPSAVKPLLEMKGRHQQQIIFATFAPNGQSAATADSREIIVWNVADGEMRYRIANPHNGAVTSIQFTPQSTLVTCGQDRTIRVWTLGEKGAAPKATIEHRTGQVPVLGVSSDGQNVLFDQDQALHVLALADQRTEGVLHAPSETAKFGAFAVFSPDNRLIIAGGTGDNPPQIWRAPANGSRGSILRRLAVGPGSEPTCAAFAPDGSFAVTGTQDGKVLVWGVPSDKEIKREITAKIGWVSKSIESSKGMVPIWAEDLVIPEGVQLLAGETVTLVITPQGSR